MRIQHVQNINPTFSAKQRFIPSKTLTNMQNLLHKMNSETQYQDNGVGFTSKVMLMIFTDKKQAFSDRRYLLRHSEKLSGTSMLELGKTELEINNQTGEIVKHNKPFYKTWKKVLNQATETISNLCDNFDNTNIVTKRFITISGFTQEGYNKLFGKKRKK